jgi:outer membrane protein TolC
MRRNKFLLLTTVLLFILNSLTIALSQDLPESGKKNKAKVIDKKSKKSSEEGLGAEIKKNKKLKLTVERVVEYLLRNNDDVKKVLLDYKGASSDLMSFRSKYDPKLYGRGAYSYSENPNHNNTAFSGTSTTVGSAGVGVEKKLRTGTTISAEVNGIYQNIEGAGIPSMGINIGGEGYQSGIKVTLKQELLKNFFGYEERLSEQKIANAEKMKKQLVRVRLAQLLVDALVGYWNVAIAEENLETSRVSMNSTINIRNLIGRKLRLGLSEREDILDWNGKVLQSRNSFDKAEKMLFDARLAVIRILSLEGESDFEIGKIFKTTAPEITYEQAIKDAFLRRVDWNNQQIKLKNARLEYKIAYSGLSPSLNLSISAGNQDYDNSSYDKTYDTINKEYSVGLEMKYPLGNTEAEVRMRNARLNLKRETVELGALEKLIRDEVTSIVKECSINFKVYEQTKKSREFAQNYYYQVYQKFRRGRYSALQLKLALDSFIISRREELKSLIDYNIALLKRDFSRNIIFKNLGIDVDSILKSLDN